MLANNLHILLVTSGVIVSVACLSAQYLPDKYIPNEEIISNIYKYSVGQESIYFFIPGICISRRTLQASDSNFSLVDPAELEIIETSHGI